MHLKFRNVNDAFKLLVAGIANGGKYPALHHDHTVANGGNWIRVSRKPSRVGEVLQIDEPVILTYSHPKERVLINAARDCNPFFHVMEALWMLAGRNDIAPLNYYSSGYAKQVQDGDSPYANGAYGYRWRKAYHQEWHQGNSMHDPDIKVDVPIDQLKVLIDHLKAKPESRRAVLQMWNVEDDLLKIDSSKDVCCNLSALFSINEGRLDMTVTNRSNDLIWGALGANYVHFSILQEYMAAHLGVEVGVYNQISNNLHVYTERFRPEAWLKEYNTDLVGGQDYETLWPFPLVRSPGAFDREVVHFVEVNQDQTEVTQRAEWQEPFLEHVAQPMCHAFHMYKDGDFEAARYWVARIEAEDWQKVAREWIAKREGKRVTVSHV